MPHSSDLIDSILKEAGFFDDMKSKLTGFLQSREKKRAVSRVGAHFDSKDKDWDRVVANSSRKSFVKELAGDARADDKLKMHVDSMNRLKTGKVLSTVSGTEGSRTARRDGSQSYKIVKLRGSNRLGCTCRDWRFKKSVAAQGEQADCKHIREFKQMNKTAGNTFSDNGQTYDVEKLWQIDRPGKVVDHESLLKGMGRTWGDRPNRYGWRDVLADPDKYPEEMARIENADLSYPILVRDRDDVVIDGIHRLLKARKTGQPATGVRVTPEDMQSALSKTAAYEEGGSFTHDGQKYSLREAFRTARTKPTKRIDVDKLKWVLQYDRPDPKRLAAADLNAPVIVAPDRRGRPTVVDGLHRLSKAVQQGKKTLPAKTLTYGELKKEAAEVISTLKPHQERVLRKLENSDGVIVAHRVGAGKTLTSIAAGVKSGRPLEIITPASLTKNYEKEIKKHVKGEVKARISSYEKAVRRGAKDDEDSVDPGSFLVLDEAHRLRNAGTLTSRTLRPAALLAQKRLLLTGTALYNQPSDIAPLANVAAGETVLPGDTPTFNKKFVRESTVSPGLLNRLLGVRPGIRKDLQNPVLLQNALTGLIDVHDEASPDDFPAQIDERINVPMSGKQKSVYNGVMGAAPFHVRRKIRAGLPPSKQESRMLNAFTTAGRQASLSPKPYVESMTEKEEAEHTPKIQEAARRLHEAKKGDKRFRGVVYSNYIEAGLKPYERALESKKIKFNTLTGKLTAKKKAKMVDEYNSGKVPVLLVSSSGTEGLDLKGTKMVQVLEPHWNNSKINQVIGRGVRYKSHAHLPPAERKVQVQRYYSSLPKGFLGMDPGKSTEQWIQDRADEKTELANQMRAVFQKASDGGNPSPKIQGHVAQRIAERAPGSTDEVAKIEAQIPSMKLRKGRTYHVPLKRGKGYAVIGDIGPKHVVKTVLGPNMRPPGHRAKVAMAGVSSRSMQKGDVVVMTMGPKTYIGKPDSSLAQRAKERVFRKTSPAMQGGYTHSGIYVGKGQIVEARGDGVRRRSLRSALKNIDGAVVVRPRADKKTREGAAEFAKSRVGAAYESEAFLTRQGVSLLAPKKMEKFLKRKSDIESTKKFTCGNLVSAAYVSQGFTPRKDKGEWSLTVPADFLNADKADRVKSMGSYADAKAKVGRLAGQKLARAPRDYKQEYAEYHGKPDQVSNRSLRNQARRKMGLKKGDPREVDHKTPISKGGGNGKGNLSAVSREFNRRKFNGS